MKGFPIGSVYKVQREHDNQKISDTLSKIKNNGFSIVVIWPPAFWWEDTHNPDYPFAAGKYILTEAERLGLSIIMELAGQIPCLEYAPDFRLKEDHLVKTREGFPTEFCESYYSLNFNHPEVKRMTADFYGSVAAAYKDFPALYGYDIWNETMFTSFDDYTLQLFRNWLKNKYGNIMELNNSWDRAYLDWNDIHFTSWHWASVMPVVDYWEFKKDNIGMILDDWRTAVRKIDTEHPVIADNVGSMITADGNFNRPQDDWVLASAADEVGFSVYPKYDQSQQHQTRWSTYTALRAATDGNGFWISELQTHTTTMMRAASYVYPHDLAWWTWEAISQGARGLIYWKWYPFIKGFQTMGRGLVNTRGEYTERSKTAASIAHVLNDAADFFTAAKPPKARAAILFDRLSQEFSKTYVEWVNRESNSLYIDSIAGLTECLWDINIAYDFIRPEDLNEKLKDYKILFITNQLNADQALADSLIAFAEQGGVLVIDGKFGIIDNTGILYDDIPGAGLTDAFGFRFSDYDYGSMDLQMKFGAGQILNLSGSFERSRYNIIDSGTEVLSEFDEHSAPACISKTLGKGRVYFFATHLWHGYHQKPDTRTAALADYFADNLELRQFSVSDRRVKHACLKAGNESMHFLFNYTDVEVPVLITHGDGGKDALSASHNPHTNYRLLYYGAGENMLNRENNIETGSDASEQAAYEGKTKAPRQIPKGFELELMPRVVAVVYARHST